MIYEGKFNYYLDGQSKTYDEIVSLVTADMTASIDGLNVRYSSPKKEIKTENKYFLNGKEVNKEDIDWKRNSIITIDEDNNLHFEYCKYRFHGNDDEAYKNYIDNSFSFTKEIKTDIYQQLCDLLGAISQETRKADGITEPTKGYDKIQELLKEADEHQKQNGGILKGAEFPFDNIVADWNSVEQKVIEDWNRKEFYIIPPSKENLDRMCDSFMDRVKNDSDKCGILNPLKEKFAVAGAKVGQKHNKLKAPLDILQTRQFPKALQLLALATAYGNYKYKDTDSDFLNFKRVKGGSQTYLDAQSRHATDRNNLDNESGLHHIIHSIWNGMAALELWAEESKINIEEYSKNYLKSLVVSK